MPYTAEHKAQTRARIVATARRLFTRRGFAEVSIDQIMAEAGLTRGGFYNHFRRKQDLYAEAVEHILGCLPDADCDGGPGALQAGQLAREYLSDRHVADFDYACPLVAFSSEVGRGDECVKHAYTQVLDSLIGMMQRSLGPGADARGRAVAMATLCVGGTMLARAIDDAGLGQEIRRTALEQVLALAANPARRAPARNRSDARGQPRADPATRPPAGPAATAGDAGAAPRRARA
ncbi:TetR/AcrR family transcriptional regulator [Lysobacter enzymogenes]|uniref:TetR/AcrR family transcriptional regulator n=1 Tax=Lysobacter enzymogenes TaxID=69 RepID=UPI0037497622